MKTTGVTNSLLTIEGEELIKKYNSTLYFIIGMILKLPSLIFWGVRIASINAFQCHITIPFGWRTQNPFRSIYFAALAGAAELSTGALCQVHLAGRGKWSMLVTHLEVQYSKKANSRITFACQQGQEIAGIIKEVEVSGIPKQLQVISIGTNEEGIEVARVFITWSFKKKD